MRWLLSLAVLLTAGCSAPGTDFYLPTEKPVSPQPAYAGPVTLVLLWDRLEVTSPEGARLKGDLGPHCAPVLLGLDPPRVHVWLAPGEHSPDALLVQRFDPASRQQVVTAGDGAKWFALGPAPLGVPAPFEGPGPVATVHVAGDTVEVGGARLAPGAVAERHAEYDVQREGATFHVQEVLTFYHLGFVQPTSAPQGMCA